MVLKYQAGGAMGCQAGSGQGAKLGLPFWDCPFGTAPVWPIVLSVVSSGQRFTAGSERSQTKPDYNLPLFQARRSITAGGAELERCEVGG